MNRLIDSVPPLPSQLDRLSEVLLDLSSKFSETAEQQQKEGEEQEEEGKKETIEEEDEEERAKLPDYISRFKVGYSLYFRCFFVQFHSFQSAFWIC